MKLSEVSGSEVSERLRGPGLPIEVGPFVTMVRSSLRTVHRNLASLYRDFPVADDGGYTDFYVSVDSARGHRRWFRPQAVFAFDNIMPFKPLPRMQAYAMLEWGMNWCFGNFSHQYLIIHAAVVARGGDAMIMPAPPGSGKSTLCAGLITRGWRLLSDETALIRSDGLVVPVPRPVNLKNRSLAIIRDFAPEAEFGETVHDTAKGTVTHMRPPADSVALAGEAVRPRWIIFPEFVPGAATSLMEVGRATTTMRMAENSFNYQVRGLEGFRLVTDIVEQCDCLTLSYSQLDEAVARLGAL